MRAFCLVLTLALCVTSRPMSFDSAKDFLEGVYLSFAGVPLENSRCLDDKSQSNLHHSLDRLFMDYREDRSLQTLIHHLAFIVPDISSVFANCGLETYVEAFSSSLSTEGDQLFLRISQEFSTIKAISADLQKQIEAGEFKLAGEQLGNMMKLMIPIGDYQLKQDRLYAFAANFTLFLEGAAMGFQAKSTPLTKCYNTTTMIMPSMNNAYKEIKKCAYLNFTACNDVPAYLTIFNSAVSSIYNDCKMETLISDIEALTDPENFVTVMFRYFSKSTDILDHFDELIQDTEEWNTYGMGYNLAYILKVLLNFSIS
ncbi:unnamed protein product [Blepharisma stoltei]|uniref:Uncharacterized protein n=1 Tax=Blepharisma stoltei TaxID=1481888 RepID=A0AAU9K4Z0_9CILI|nr:unnamed protein product [Blepharisma stoltei]